MGIRLPYKIKDLKTVQRNFDYLTGIIVQGTQGFCRVEDIVSGGGAGNAVNKGWTFTTAFIDSNYYQVGTPPGTPAGVACAANSGVLIKQKGVYRIIANLLCQGLGGVGGRYDSNIAVLTSAGLVRRYVDQCLVNVPAGAAHVKHTMTAEIPVDAGEWVWPFNNTAPTYGDAGGGWSHMEIRYQGK